MKNADILRTSFTSKRLNFWCKPLNRETLHYKFRFNKLINRYTIMIKGFPATNDGIDELINSEKGQNRNLGGALTRNNKWCNVSYKRLFLDFFQ